MGWQLIESQSLQSSAASVTFSNIPQTYKSLMLAFSTRITTAGYDGTPWVTGQIALNSAGNTPNAAKQLFGTGAAAGSDTNLQPVFSSDTDATALTFSNGYLVIPNYTGSQNKAMSCDVVTENNGSSALQICWAGVTNISAAVTSIIITPAASFAFGSTLALYGLA